MLSAGTLVAVCAACATASPTPFLVTATPLATITPELQPTPTVDALLPFSLTLIAEATLSTPVTPEPTATREPLATRTPTPESTSTTESVPTSPPVPTIETATPVTQPATTPIPSGSAPFVVETSISILTYAWRDHLKATSPGDPIYPYPRLDYDPNTFVLPPPVSQTYKAVALENEFVRLTFLPELGGRLYRWEDKLTGRNLLYNNPIVRPVGWGYRGWYLPVGGVEWSLPVGDHGFVEWRPWTYTTATAANAVSITLSITDDKTGLAVSVKVTLDSGHSYFTLTPTLRNPTGNPIRYQFWTAAIAAPGGDNRAGNDLQFIVPVSTMTVHSTDDKGLPAAGGTFAWPNYNGRDMSTYGNWREFLSIFGYPAATRPFMGLYASRVDQGFVRIFSPETTRGVKLFGPGNLPTWVWTSDDSSYVELWGGLTPTFSEDVTLQSNASLSWNEQWYPYAGMGKMEWANRDMALSLREANNIVTVGLYTTSAQLLQISLLAGGLEAQSWPVVTSRAGAWSASWTRTLAGALEVQVQDVNGAVLARYTPNP
jgi:hypothetical protein